MRRSVTKELLQHETEFGSLILNQAAPDVLLIVMKGRCDLSQAHAYMRVVEQVYKGERAFHHFFDMGELDSYVSGARTQLTRFAIAERSHVASSTFLVRSKLVAMGVSTASLAAQLAGLHFKTTADRHVFDERLRARTSAMTGSVTRR